MAKPQTHKKQHWVPRSYLAAWCDPDTPEGHDPYVWRFAKDGRERDKKSPKNIFHETDLYTIRRDDGTRNLDVEHGLAGLESHFVRIRDEFLAKARPIGADDNLLLRAFTAAMLVRSMQHLTHWQNQMNNAVQIGEQFKRTMEAMAPQERAATGGTMLRPGSNSGSVTLEDFKRVAEGSMGPFVGPMSEIQLPYLARMSLVIMTTNEDPGFITSDKPCVWFDPEASKRPPAYQTPSLEDATLEIRLPISPTQILILNRLDMTGYQRASERFVADLNRITRDRADKHFIVNRDETKDVWFAEQPPADDSEND